MPKKSDYQKRALAFGSRSYSWARKSKKSGVALGEAIVASAERE